LHDLENPLFGATSVALPLVFLVPPLQAEPGRPYTIIISYRKTPYDNSAYE